MNKVLSALTVLMAIAAVLAGFGYADEGMWTFDNPPRDQIRKTYGIELTDAWLDHLRKSSVRLGGIGSASFVSENGLILTNHHVAANCVQGLSSETEDFMKDGFGADKNVAPRRCPGMEAHVLMATEDVTARVLAAIPDGASDADSFAARKAETAKIEQECDDAGTDLCEVAAFYAGGEYWLHRYKRYDDVRLVLAPESQVASFGGDPDNFNYPRYCLDFALLRAYGADGKPVRPVDWLTVKPGAYKEGDPMFVAGHPTSSSRFTTYAQLEFERDHLYPFWKRMMERERGALTTYAATGEEAERRALLQIQYLDNFIKVADGYLRGLNDRTLMARKKAEEDRFRQDIAADPSLAARVGGAFEGVARAQKIHEEFFDRYRLILLRGSRLFRIAGHIVRVAAEKEKPNEERLEEFRDSALEGFLHSLYSPSPIYADMEEVLLRDRLQLLAEELGDDDPATKAALGGRAAEDVARETAAGSTLYDPDARKALVEGGVAAVAASADPMIRLARALDPMYRELRARYEEEIEEVEQKAGERIASARFKLYGRDTYPDTTFTLRLSFGRVAGYVEDGYRIPYQTTLFGLFDRGYSFEEQPPYDLPPRWKAKRNKMDLGAAINSVNTADTFPGNSGSPAVNARGELIGTLFDGNLPSLEIQFVYDEVTARSIMVDARAIVESLRSVYGRRDLADEMIAGH